MLCIYGTGGFAREVLELARKSVEWEREYHYYQEHAHPQIVFLDDNKDLWGSSVLGCPVIGLADAIPDASVALAIADGQVRRRLAEKIVRSGRTLETLTDQTHRVLVQDTVDVAAGGILCAHTTLTTNIKIGQCFHANLYSYVGHDCVIGDYVTLAPRVSINGNCRIGNNVYIGTGAMLRQGVAIADDVTIGMGAVVLDDVPAGQTVVGNPAREIKKH